MSKAARFELGHHGVIATAKLRIAVAITFLPNHGGNAAAGERAPRAGDDIRFTPFHVGFDQYPPAGKIWSFRKQ